MKGVSIKAEKLSAYNLTVETDHTYFIKGANSDVDGVWVHNDCFLDKPKQKVNTTQPGDIVRTPVTQIKMVNGKLDLMGEIPLIRKRLL